MAKTPEEMESWVKPLADAGVDIFDCSQRRFWEPEFEGSDLNFAGWVKKLSGKATMTVGSVGLATDLMSSFAEGGTDVRSLDELQRRFDRGDFDLVAVGRTLLSDAAWVEKIRDQRTSELKPFKPADMATLA
jgi:2,4-dienoyl-CoA reductase-like NADH-dependent reductase (Old Yellow Enzyme family)